MPSATIATVCASVVCLLAAQAAGFQIDDIPFNVIPETEAARPDTVLSHAWLDVRELLDWVRERAIVRVSLEDIDNLRITAHEFPVTAQ